MPLDIGVQLQLINTMLADGQLSRTIDPEGTSITDNLLYLAEVGLIALTTDPVDQAGNVIAVADLTTAGHTFEFHSLGREVVLKSQIREKLKLSPDISEVQYRCMRQSLEEIPGGVHGDGLLRLVDMGLSGKPNAVSAALEYLTR